MGKQRKKSSDSTKKSNSRKNSAIEESKVVEAEVYESDLVKMKKENQKIMDKAVKRMESSVKSSLNSK